MNATDSLKALAKQYATTPAALRAIAADLGIAYAYSKGRRTWYLAADATTVRAFSQHLGEHNATETR